MLPVGSTWANRATEPRNNLVLGMIGATIEPANMITGLRLAPRLKIAMSSDVTGIPGKSLWISTHIYMDLYGTYGLGNRPPEYLRVTSFSTWKYAILRVYWTGIANLHANPCVYTICSSQGGGCWILSPDHPDVGNRAFLQTTTTNTGRYMI